MQSKDTRRRREPMARLCISFAIAAAIGCFTAIAASAADSYLLGAGDHVEVKVSDLRAGTGEAYQWTVFTPGLSGFVVGPGGRLSLPVVGEIDAAGKTTSEIEAAISTRLQQKAGLAAKPDTSVQIVKFRPFYIVGDVDKPGEYDYRPGLTVLQAVGIAGGLMRASNDIAIGLMRDALSARGDMRTLAVDRLALMARQARLDAEINGLDAPAYPAELKAKANDPDVARILREEQLLFESRRDGLTRQIAALEQTKTYLHSEIDNLNQKSVTIARQLAAQRKEKDLVASLVTKGLTVAPRQLELEQNIAQTENNDLDVRVATIRANEDIAKADHDILDLKTVRRNDMLQEASDVRTKLGETIEKMQTSAALVQHAEVNAPMLAELVSATSAQPTYVLSHRGADGKAADTPAQEADLVGPGDVVRVMARPKSSPLASAAPAAPGAPAPAAASPAPQ